MILDHIDRALAEWQSRLALASSNLLELDDLYAYQHLRWDADRPPARVTGITQARVGPALVAADDLWLLQGPSIQLLSVETPLAQFDPALGMTLDINQNAFVAPVVAVLIAGLAWLGLAPRIQEYHL